VETGRATEGAAGVLNSTSRSQTQRHGYAVIRLSSRKQVLNGGWNRQMGFLAGDGDEITIT